MSDGSITHRKQDVNTFGKEKIPEVDKGDFSSKSNIKNNKDTDIIEQCFSLVNRFRRKKFTKNGPALGDARPETMDKHIIA